MQKLHYDDGTAFKEAACLEKLNKNEEAITCLTNLLKRNPEDDAGYEARGKNAGKVGTPEKAVADYTRHSTDSLADNLQREQLCTKRWVERILQLRIERKQKKFELFKISEQSSI